MNENLTTHESYLNHALGELYIKYWKVAQSELAPIILFHESLGSVEQWKDFPEQLALSSGRTVIAYDRIGFGKSSGTTGLVPLDFVRSEALQTFPLIREFFNFDRFVAMGHSIGGGYATGCAIEYPELCEALILESVASHTDEHMRKGVQQAKMAFQNIKWLERLKRYHGEKAETVLNAWTESWLSESFRTWSIEQEISLLKCPTLILHPANDEYGTIEQANKITRVIQVPYQLEIIADSGHVPHHQYPALVIEKITHFLHSKI